jgi:hypothetical protein
MRGPYDGPGSTPLFNFDKAGGFCGIAWNDAGITRFQLPTKSAEATERILLRHVPGAKPGAPTPEVAEAVAAVRRYFGRRGDGFFQRQARPGRAGPLLRARLCRGAPGRMGAHHNLWRSGEGARRPTGSRARCRPGHGEESGGADHPLPQGPGGRREGRRIFRARRLGGQDPHAFAGGRSLGAGATGTAIFRLLRRKVFGDDRSASRTILRCLGKYFLLRGRPQGSEKPRETRVTQMINTCAD